MRRKEVGKWGKNKDKRKEGRDKARETRQRGVKFLMEPKNASITTIQRSKLLYVCVAPNHVNTVFMGHPRAVPAAPDTWMEIKASPLAHDCVECPKGLATSQNTKKNTLDL